MKHVPVLLNACIEGLQLRQDGTYVDVTFGNGGHAQEILKGLEEGQGHLYAFDQDQAAAEIAAGVRNRSFTYIDANYRYLKQWLRFYGVKEVDGVLADLGVSSPQIDTPERGFSFRFDGPLDMRMDASATLTAEQVVNRYTAEQLQHLFSRYGEVRNAKTLARKIVEERRNKAIQSTQALADIALSLAPKKMQNKYLARLFQALRMEVNDEETALKSMLEQAGALLKPGGRLVVMAYHSLEDRLVKYYMKTGNTEGIEQKDWYGNIHRPFKLITKKPVQPEETEQQNNARARSARLRIAEKQ